MTPRRTSAAVTVHHYTREDGTLVEVRCSPRRRRTVSARWEDGRVVVLAPGGVDLERSAQVIDALVTKVVAGQALREAGPDLVRLADRLATRFLPPGVVPCDIRYVDNQRHRWGSCTPATREIRISGTARTMPAYVVEALVLHELAHLVHANHGPQFKALVQQHPRYAEAMAFLNGFDHARRTRQEWDDAPPTTGDDEAGWEDLSAMG